MRKAEIWLCRRIFLDDPVGPDAAISPSFVTTAPRASIKHISTSNARPPKLDRLAVCEQFAAVRKDQKTPERNARQRFGDGIHRLSL